MGRVPAEQDPEGPASQQTDAELIRGFAADPEIVAGELYRRHVPVAGRILHAEAGSSQNAEDAVSEAFARLLVLMREGRGPRHSFRPYLLRTARTVLRSARNRTDVVSVGDLPEPPWAEAAEHVVLGWEQQQIVREAFHALPERWRRVLWRLEVEDHTPQQVGQDLEMGANAVSALALRAKDRLRENFLAASTRWDPSGECDAFASMLGPYVRGRLPKGRVRRLRMHLESCPRCTSAYLGMLETDQLMRAWVWPVLLIPAAGGVVGEAVLPSSAVSGTERPSSWSAGIRHLRQVVRVGVPVGVIGAAVLGAALFLSAPEQMPDSAPGDHGVRGGPARGGPEPGVKGLAETPRAEPSPGRELSGRSTAESAALVAAGDVERAEEAATGDPRSPLSTSLTRPGIQGPTAPVTHSAGAGAAGLGDAGQPTVETAPGGEASSHDASAQGNPETAESERAERGEPPRHQPHSGALPPTSPGPPSPNLQDPQELPEGEGDGPPSSEDAGSGAPTDSGASCWWLGLLCCQVLGERESGAVSPLGGCAQHLWPFLLQEQYAHQMRPWW